MEGCGFDAAAHAHTNTIHVSINVLTPHHANTPHHTQVTYDRVPDVEWNSPYADIEVTVQDTGVRSWIGCGVQVDHI